MVGLLRFWLENLLTTCDDVHGIDTQVLDLSAVRTGETQMSWLLGVVDVEATVAARIRRSGGNRRHRLTIHSHNNLSGIRWAGL